MLCKEMCKKFHETCKPCKIFVRLRQKHENYSNITSFVVKSLNFTQHLENFAQTCVSTSAALLLDELISDKGVCSTAPATPGL